MLNVTKTVLPPLEEYTEFLKKIWETRWVTNSGPLLEQLEDELKKYLGVKHIFVVNNGTIALQIAIKALELEGEVITTPFSYVASASTISWEKCYPRFVDIKKENLTIDTDLIEKNITEKTTAILTTHVYGIPSDVKKIAEIAGKYNLKVIYDAAHCFKVDYNNTSILSYGEISTLSFHATKIFHTVEGGALVTNDDELAKRIFYLRNFGHKKGSLVEFDGIGINGKMSELHAAMGLCMLPRVNELISVRKELTEYYDSLLFRNNSELSKPLIDFSLTRYNYGYYPLILPSEAKLLVVQDNLIKNKIFPRRYFYPSLNLLNYVEYHPCPVAEDISKRVLCLPLFPELEYEDITRTCNIILSSL